MSFVKQAFVVRLPGCFLRISPRFPQPRRISDWAEMPPRAIVEAAKTESIRGSLTRYFFINKRLESWHTK